MDYEHMMQRTLIVQTPQAIGQPVRLEGWVHTRRDHGKIIFLDLRDRSGVVQIVVVPSNAVCYAAAKDVRAECVVEIIGTVKERPGGTVNEHLPTGGVEIECTSLSVLARPVDELPVDITKEDMELQLSTLLDHRSLTLRNKKINDIFAVYDCVLRSYAAACRMDGFREIKTPKILAAATEGGANFFKINYFDRSAYLAQSPQFYKQAGVGAFERVFEIGPVFRAEPHFTARHVNEYISLDAEMGFIDGFEDVMIQLEKVLKSITVAVAEQYPLVLEEYGQTLALPEHFPRMKLAEAMDILKKHYGKETDDGDIDAEGEKLICEYVKKEYDSDAVFLTHYPVAVRPMYVMPSPDDPMVTESFDLLYRGVEIATGGQRIHIYDDLVVSIKKHGLSPEDFSGYLAIFKNGMPPHGGWGMGSERVVQKMLGLGNVREAILFPRDVKRLEP